MMGNGLSMIDEHPSRIDQTIDGIFENEADDVLMQTRKLTLD